jgi:hypothetical protein
MQVHPEIAALRRDDTPQRQAQAALAATQAQWEATSPVRAVLAGLEQMAEGADLADSPALAALFTPGAAARQFAGGFVSTMCAALAEQPLGHVPLRHFTDGANSTLLLGRAGAVALTLVALDAAGLARKPAPRSVTLSPTVTWEAVIGGGGMIERISVTPRPGGGAKLDVETRTLAPGMVHQRDGRQQGVIYRSVDGCMIVLRLQRRLADDGVVYEYDLTDGTLLHRANGSPLASRYELMAALLGRMGRADAAPLLAELAGENGASGMRWQALRECLGLDTATGFAALDMIARRVDDPLAAAAGALRAQLVESWPQLAEIA